MNSLTRIVAGTLGAGVLAMTAATTASAATTDGPSSDASSTDGSSATGSTGASPEHGTPSSDGTPAPEPGGTALYALPGVGAVPVPDATFGVPKVLEVVETPFGALADLAGEGGSKPGPNGAQAGPGSADGN